MISLVDPRFIEREHPLDGWGRVVQSSMGDARAADRIEISDFVHPRIGSDRLLRDTQTGRHPSTGFVMPLIYRTMLREGASPKVGPSKKELGVKLGSGRHDDVAPDAEANVGPGMGGMSVAPHWEDLPTHRIPRRLRPKCAEAAGSDNCFCWRMGSGPFENSAVNEQLNLFVDSIHHGTVQPGTTMSAKSFQQALCHTVGRVLKHMPFLIAQTPLCPALSPVVLPGRWLAVAWLNALRDVSPVV